MSEKRAATGDDEESAQSATKRRGVNNEESLINSLTLDQVDKQVAHLRTKYEFVSNSRGCLTLGVKKTSSKSAKAPKSLARRNGGYLQVTLAAEVFTPQGGKQQPKVDFHQLMYRHHSRATIAAGIQLAHRCSVADCGARDHVIVATRAVNEEHKRCCYVRALNGEIFLMCKHDPLCCPDPAVILPLHPVPDGVVFPVAAAAANSNIDQ
jgi:hypothetical protein